MRRKVLGADTVVCVIDWENCASVIPIFAHNSPAVISRSNSVFFMIRFIFMRTFYHIFSKKTTTIFEKTLDILNEKC